VNLLTFLQLSIKGKLSPEIQVEFLGSKTDITPKELANVVRFLQKQIPNKPYLKNAIDICGTGGSGLERINTSTISAFILAKLGIPVAKHGNKAASGRFGGFDLLESLGIKFTDNISDIEEKFKKERLAFLFAPFFYPVMKNFAEMRKKIGRPTFFNLLGPLLNPAFPKKQIIGTTFKDKMELIAETCLLLGKEKVYVVCGEDGLDEVTLTGKTQVMELSNGNIKSYTITPENFGIKSAVFHEIKGGNAQFNTRIATDILKGECKTRHKDLVLINTALALKLTDKVRTLKEGYEAASQAINTPDILLKIVEHKRKEIGIAPSTRDFAGALGKNGLSLIAEIKRASPSAGTIYKKNFSPSEIARNYENSGADAISVVCDKKFFDGDLKYLKETSKSTSKTPILCKDFIIDASQIYEARKHGADAILLIASILTEKQMEDFITVAKSLNMDALCEVHTLNELSKVLKTSAQIIGINNRNLHTFKVDISTTAKIAKHIPPDKIVVSESGFHSAEDIEKLPENVSAILVGTALMKGTPISEFIGKKLKICGIRSVEDAKFCDKLGVDFIGLNFVPSSKRFISIEKAREIRKAVKKTKIVGVFQNQPLEEINTTAKKLNLDYIQLSGNESVKFVKKCCKPVIKGISIRNENNLKKAGKYLPYAAYILLDGSSPGAGKPINIDLKNVNFPFLLAGGLTPENMKKTIKETNPLGIDIASGAETNGEIDRKKIGLIFNKLKSC